MRIFTPSFLIPIQPASALIPFVTSGFDGRGPGYGSSYADADGSGDAGGGRSIAPGKVTLTSRIPGRPGEAPGGSPLTEPYSSYAPRPVLDDPFGLHLESGVAQPASQVAATRLAASPQVDFGEVPVGEIHREGAYVYNLHGTGSAYVSALLAGSHDIQVGHPQPDRLRPSREDPGIPFTLVYQPNEGGKAQATLTVHAAWEAYTGWAPMTLQIPVTATAYVYGEERPSVVEAERAGDQGRAEAEAAAHARDAALDKKVETDNQIDAPYPQGAENLLHNAFSRAHDALDLLGEHQAVGIGIAASEADAFHRKVPIAVPGLLTSLALGALDMATYGLAGMASSWARSVMSKKITIPPQWRLRKGVPVPPAAGATPTETTNLPLSVAISVAEALKKGIRDAGKSGREALQGALTRTEMPGAPTSDDARIEFFAEQRIALANSKNGRAEALRDALSRLRPLMRSKKPEDAAAAMDAIAVGLEKAVENAKNVQTDETRFGWMRFLAQTELGSDIGAALDLPRENAPLPGHDGLLDLELTANYNNPRGSLKITHAKMNGVTPAMASSLSVFPLSELLKRGVVIRAHFKIPELAVMPVVVAFDGDRVRYEDETGADGQAPRWLSFLGGYTGRPSPERQRLGALALRDWLKTMQLDQLGLQVETDHDGR